jgi:hypothetical protein
LEVKNYGGIPNVDFSLILTEVHNHKSLQDLLRWAEKQPEGSLVPGAIAELVVQDEFTHDIVVPWKNIFLVYGTT